MTTIMTRPYETNFPGKFLTIANFHEGVRMRQMTDEGEQDREEENFVLGALSQLRMDDPAEAG